MTDSSDEQETYRIILGYLLMPENKEVLKNKLMVVCQRDTGANFKNFRGQRWNNLSNKINNVVLSYNSKYKIIVHESILIKIND